MSTDSLFAHRIRKYNFLQLQHHLSDCRKNYLDDFRIPLYEESESAIKKK